MSLVDSGLISPENTPLEVLSALICSPEPIELELGRNKINGFTIVSWFCINILKYVIN